MALIHLCPQSLYCKVKEALGDMARGAWKGGPRLSRMHTVGVPQGHCGEQTTGRGFPVEMWPQQPDPCPHGPPSPGSSTSPGAT